VETVGDVADTGWAPVQAAGEQFKFEIMGIRS